MQLLSLTIKIKDDVYLITFEKDKIVIEGGNAKYIPWGEIGNAIAEAVIDIFNENFKT